ncbi:MAG: histidinol dehydrogenase [Leadbetterella sp.]
MKILYYPKVSEFADICKRPVMNQEDLNSKVRQILDNVRIDGDNALKKYAFEFDNQVITDFEVDSIEIQNSDSKISSELKGAIDTAYDNIYRFHENQKYVEAPVETMPGVNCYRKSVAIDKVGFYIPGGTAPLFSTILMLGVPAQIAGCKERIMCTPSDNPAIYYAAKKVGITRVFRVGGAQAIAAMTFGTSQIPNVYKIFGPGNQYVTTAKQMATQFGIAIDMPAGPSEVAIYADETSIPEFVSADLLSQAEHGADSQVLLVSTSKDIIHKIIEVLSIQLAELPRVDLASKSIQNSKAVLVETQEQAIDLLNMYAAEHLILATDDFVSFSDKITNAGSVFLGHYTPESCGDYASGTNHTLPTNGYAKAYSGVSLDSFVKKITYQNISKDGLKAIGRTVEIMAEAEGLSAHKNAVTIRLNSLKN